MNKLYVIIMAGGVGSRLWPMSTHQKPKQFVDLLGTGETLLQSTYQRALHLTPAEQVLVVTNKQWVHLVQEQLPGILPSQMVVEPMRKNTATATLYAINKIANRDPQADVVIMPCDHVITDVNRFGKVIKAGLKYILKNAVLLTVGIKVSRPEVNYGYIQYLPEAIDNQVYNIKTFTEKPTKEIANAFHRSGDFLWYSGIKVVSVGTLLDLYAEHLPDTAQLFEEMRPYLNEEEEERFIEKIYPQCETIAFRQAIIYKAEDKVKVLLGDFGWTDITLWGEVYATHEKDYLGNAVTGAQVVMYDASNCLVEVAGDKLVIISGLEDYIVADSPKGLLICPRDQENEIKNMLLEIKRQVGDKYL
ncbi:MAG: mannose-1-phosphate guanylyltransferase [Sphingobacteriaceae bacterium]|nr:mannose-1-phosphate guanylyltransferase [Sphingobacteriaceae bacterium]